MSGRPSWRALKLRLSRLDPVSAGLILFTAAALIYLVASPTAQPPRPEATVKNAELLLRLEEPRLLFGTINDWRSGAVQEWLAGDKLTHAVRGRLQQPSEGLRVRPWLYTTTWLPQPVVDVASDGSFSARVYFDREWRSDLVLCLEIEDSRAGRIIASYNYFFREGSR